MAEETRMILALDSHVRSPSSFSRRSGSTLERRALGFDKLLDSDFCRVCIPPDNERKRKRNAAA